MNINGIIIGLCSFLIIGIFHPIVIKSEFHFGKKVWPLFLIVGVALLIVSLFIKHSIGSPVLGVTGFSCLWSIKELFEQERRVQKGWFPKKEK
ncbi:MAG: hypothetical protein K0R90_1288 [Oscillospiraceae bacterium]|nr:hypothetical protein [Oscillospiraceae bacterium]